MKNEYLPDDFEIENIPNRRMPEIPQPIPEFGKIESSKLEDAAAEHFGQILNIANEIVACRKMQIQAEAYTNVMKEKEQMLIRETDAYVRKKEAQTKATVGKAEVIAQMLRDFYSVSDQKMSGEEFSKVLQAVIEKIQWSNSEL